MTKILKPASILILCLTFIISGCSSSSSSEDSNNEGIVLRVFGPSQNNVLAPEEDGAEEIQERAIAGFLEENPEVAGVDWQAQGTLEDGVQRMMNAKLSNEPIDLISCEANMTNRAFIGSGVVKDITDNIDAIEDRIVPSSLDSYSRDGKVYGVPISKLSTTSFFYNKNLFDSLDLEVPKTYEKLVEISNKLNDEGITPVLHQGKDLYMWPIWYFETFAQTSGGKPVDKTISNLEGDTKFNDPEDVKALEVIGQFVKDGILEKDSLAMGKTEMRSSFAQQDTAMYFGQTTEQAWIEENITDFEVGIIEFPALDDSNTTLIHPGGADYGICMSSDIDPEKVPYAQKFIEYVTETDVAETYVGTAPLGASIKSIEKSEDQLSKEMQNVYNPDNFFLYLDWIWPTKITDAYQSSIQNIVGGNMTAEEAANNIQEVYDNMVKEGYEYGQE